MAIDARPLGLRPVVEAAIDAVRPLARAKGVWLEVRVEANGVRVVGDAGLLQQAVANLLSNAVKASDVRGVVRVTLERDQRAARIRVTDTGRGIPGDDLLRVFEPFYQGAEASGNRSGLGLGLAIVRQVATLHGGTAWADSTGEGQGSTFTVELPVLDDQPVQGEPHAAGGSTDEARRR